MLILLVSQSNLIEIFQTKSKGWGMKVAGWTDGRLDVRQLSMLRLQGNINVAGNWNLTQVREYFSGVLLQPSFISSPFEFSLFCPKN